VPVRPERLFGSVRREVVLNAAAALQIALVALLPFLPFLLHFDAGSASLAPRSSFFIVAGFLLLALLARWAYFGFALFYIPLSVLSIHLVQRFGNGGWGWQLDQPDSRVETFFESPPGETREYFHAHWWLADTAMLALGLVFLVLLAWVFRTRPRLTPAAKGAVVLALGVWATIAAVARLDRYLDQWPQYQLVYAAIEARTRSDRLADRDEAITHEALPTEDCTGRYRKVVIVLGESAAPRHMSAFGYHRKTTPFLDQSRPHLFEALAPANQTRVSLVTMLTTADNGNFDDFYEKPSLVSRLAACGYRTLWISNQGRVGRHDSTVSSIAREADQEVFLNELSYKDVQHDGELLAELGRLGAFDATRQATFIHLIGSHTAYAKRYPAGFGLPGARSAVDHYDNSILYTDSLLAELYKRFGADKTLFIYVPDHGEVVTDKVFGHGFSPGYREEYEVPLAIWTHDHAAVGELRQALRGKKLNLESFDDLVSYLVGSATALHASTSDLVSNLSPHNQVRYEDLRAFHRSKSDK
jgi:glucan phosphoethanolaminetransferase (alkaline phosphatase superfamily)